MALRLNLPPGFLGGCDIIVIFQRYADCMSLTQQISTDAAVYHPRIPTASPMYRLLVNHFDKFEAIYEERFTKSHGFYRQVVSDVVHAYLKCGDLKEGFARVRCPDCHYEYLLAFSYRGRWFPESRSSLTFHHAMRKKLYSLVKYCGKIFFILFHTANMFSAFQ